MPAPVVDGRALPDTIAPDTIAPALSSGVRGPSGRSHRSTGEHPLSKYRSTPAEQMYPGLATRKRQAAERREAEAVRLRAEALELDRKWREHVIAQRRHLAEEQSA